MASSFLQQIPTILHVVQKLKPKSILDIGKGFGKYGFLIHEYAGIDNTRKLDPSMSLKKLSSINIDAVEVDADLMLPHLDHLYHKIYFKDILSFYKTLPVYDLILMVDIIEHINKEGALKLLEHFLDQGSNIIIATPIHFFEQELYESEYERHISHWTKKDFAELGNLSIQFIDAGAVYLLTKEKIDIRGFGNSWIKKIRRISRAIRNEL